MQTPQCTVLLALVCLGNATLSAKDSPAETEFKKRADAVGHLVRADPLNWSAAETQAEALLKDYPRRFDSYLDMLVLTWQAEMAGKRDLERTLATTIVHLDGPDPSETPDWAGNPVGWARGVIHRLDLAGKAVDPQFTAIDGRIVDVTSLRGKVVVVDFWATWCPPCVSSLPGLKAAFAKYHEKGLEVLAISWDLDLGKLSKFVEQNGIPWPQHFEGSRRKFGEEFGIGGIPYTLLIGKDGRLRYSTASPNDPRFVDEIQRLLAE
jgi:thiol-disulfide isomerase/thioredoxin